jgi:hypothetical protein
MFQFYDAKGSLKHILWRYENSQTYEMDGGGLYFYLRIIVNFDINIWVTALLIENCCVHDFASFETFIFREVDKILIFRLVLSVIYDCLLLKNWQKIIMTVPFYLIFILFITDHYVDYLKVLQTALIFLIKMKCYFLNRFIRK